MSVTHRTTLAALGLLLSGGAARAESAPLAAPGPAAATAAAPASPIEVNRRALNGHEFPPASYLEAPMAVSSIGLDDRLSGGTASGPKLLSDGTPGTETRDYSYGGMVTSMRFQTLLGEEFTVRGTFQVSLFSGVDGASALVVGTTVQPGLALGAEWSRQLGERWRIGLSFDAEKAPQLNLLIAAAIAWAIEHQSMDFPSVLQLDDVVTYNPAVTAAWVPFPALGLVGRLGYSNSSLETPDAGTAYRQAITLGLLADLDLKRYWPPIKMNASLAYTDSIPVGDSISGVRDVSLGLMYTGNPDLAAGVIVGSQWLRIRPQYDDPLSSTSPYLTVVLRAYWP